MISINSKSKDFETMSLSTIFGKLKKYENENQGQGWLILQVEDGWWVHM